ncbi:WXG100 family type VII secretion target [Nocardia sp. NBC_00416]|uniref:WXG100 family type VII secretion target n=1 Tax=Nocardia sp. NBC_00416 TaxID=2975991 RepID=UPI002E1C3009
MNYDRGVLDTLIDQLDSHRMNLTNEVHRLDDVAKKLINVAWENNDSAVTFQGAQSRWADAFSDTNTKLGNLRTAVVDARDNAFIADRKVSDSFGV